MALVDEMRFRMVIENIIDNASKYTPAGGNIRLRLQNNTPNPGDVTLYIEDSGAGIPEAERQRVFDRFYRVGGDRHDPNTQGSGLGLSIVRHIVELHRARLRLETSTLGGLCVMICFPASQRCDTGAPP